MFKYLGRTIHFIGVILLGIWITSNVIEKILPTEDSKESEFILKSSNHNKLVIIE